MALNFPNNPNLNDEWTDGNGERWIFTGDMWQRTVNVLQGPQGPKGDQGDQGIQGDPGEPGPSDHQLLTNRNPATNDAHEQASIVGLVAALGTKLENITGEALGDLSNVSAAAPGTDDVLTWTGATWAPAAIPTPVSSLDGLSDVTITAPGAGQLLEHNGAIWVNAVNTAVKQGLHTIWIPAAAMTSTTTNGAAFNSVELATNAVMISTMDFDETINESAQFAIRMPKSWDGGTITYSVSWSHSGATAYTCHWILSGTALSDSEALDTAFSGGVLQSDGGIMANMIFISPTSSALTIAGTPAAEDYVLFRIERDAANVSDNLNADARLHGVTIHYTVDAATDA